MVDGKWMTASAECLYLSVTIRVDMSALELHPRSHRMVYRFLEALICTYSSAFCITLVSFVDSGCNEAA